VLSRWLRPVLLAALVGGLYFFQRTVLRPEPARLEAFAEAALTDIFGPHLTHGRVVAHPLDGVRIEGLRVQGPDDPAPTLEADAVELRHDPLAITAGVLRLTSVVLVRPRISTHETADGELELDFPFEPPKVRGGRPAPPPTLAVTDGTFRLRAHAESAKFRSGYVLELGAFHAKATPAADGTVRVEGGFLPQGLGMAADEEITFQGTANLEEDRFDVLALWARVLLTPEVRAVLAPDLLARVETQRFAEGPHRLSVRVTRDPDVEAGRVRVFPRFEGTVRLDIGAVPGAETIDARTRDQINELFGKIDLSLELSGGRIDIRRLSTSLAGAEVRAQGRIEDDGELVDLDLRIEGLRLDDPALLAALGPVGDEIRDEFSAAGRADVLVTLRKDHGGPFRYEAVVDLIDATFVYVGKPMKGRTTPSGRPMRDGFPYAAEHCFGRVTVTPGEVRFDAIEGRHRGARIRVRGAGETSRTGGPTGYVRWGGGDTEVRLTVEATSIPVDADLEAAVEGSTFAGFLDRFRPIGTVDRLVVDVVKEAHVDVAAAVELDVDLFQERFRYAPFPLELDPVDARVSLVRPLLADGTGRGRRFDVRARGRAAGAEVTVDATIDEHARRGRVRVAARGARIEGDLEAAVKASDAGKGALGDVWSFLRPRGTVDLVADLPAGDDPGPERWELTLRDVSVRLGDDGPDAGLDVAGLAGAMRVVGGDAEIVELRGRVGRAPIAVSGTVAAGARGRWDLRVETERIAVTRGLLNAIQRASPCGPIFPQGVTIAPTGHLDLALQLRRDPASPDCELTAAVTVRNAELEARIGDLRLAVRGGFSVDGDDVRMEGLSLEGSGLRLSIPKGRYGPDGIEGRLSARMTDLVVTPELLGLLPESLRATFADATKDRLLQAPSLEVDVDDKGGLTVRGALGLTARPKAPPGGAPRGLVELAPLVVSAADARGDRAVRGRLLLRGLDLDVGTRLEETSGVVEIERLLLGDAASATGTLRLDHARVAGLSLTDVVVPIRHADGILTAAPFEAAFYGGRLTGRVVVHTRAPVAFEGALTATGVSLEALRGDIAPTLEIRGVVGASVEFESPTGSFDALFARGTVEVRDGDLGELPPVASLPALLGSLVPDGRRPKFTRADVAFRLEGERLLADRLVLAGPLFEMEGQGVYDLAGTVDVTLAPQFVKSLLLPGALQLPGLGDLLGVLREDPLYVVRIRGPIATAKPVLDPLPFLGAHRAAPEPVPVPFTTTTSRRIPRWFR
jgi:hypothetical protein